MNRYPAIEPHAHGMLQVGDGQHLYWECSGNPEGQAALYLHGGPGCPSSGGARRFFDPKWPGSELRTFDGGHGDHEDFVTMIQRALDDLRSSE